MATLLTKAIHRQMLSSGQVRGKHRNRPIIVSLLPGDELEFRFLGTRQRASVYLGHCMNLAWMLQIDKKYKEDLKAYAERKKSGRARRPKKPVLPYSDFYVKAASINTVVWEK